MKPVMGVGFAGGGIGTGLLRDLVDIAWAVEMDSEIAEVHRTNFPETRMIVEPAQNVNLHALEPVDIAWFSPPCQQHSIARSKKLTKRDDGDVGIVILDYVRACNPRAVIIENVVPYLKAPVLKKIEAGLFATGYWVSLHVLNAADYGVPQTRRRMFLIAMKDQMYPFLPEPVPWIGWYEAIQDLIPTLPESKFAQWQLDRLEASLTKNQRVVPPFFIGGANKSQSFLDYAIEHRPSIPGIRNGDEPMNTIPSDVAVNMAGRAFIVHPSEMRNTPIIDGEQPIFTIMAGSFDSSHAPSWNPRAFIVDGKPARFDGIDLAILDEHDPVNTITAPQVRHPFRAFLVNQDSKMGMVPSDDPAFTILATSKTAGIRALLEQGRVVGMTPRALARFQSVPDSYILPDKKTLACKVIGNGVPSLLARRLVESVL